MPRTLFAGTEPASQTKILMERPRLCRETTKFLPQLPHATVCGFQLSPDASARCLHSAWNLADHSSGHSHILLFGTCVSVKVLDDLFLEVVIDNLDPVLLVRGFCVILGGEIPAAVDEFFSMGFPDVDGVLFPLLLEVLVFWLFLHMKWLIINRQIEAANLLTILYMI